MEKIWALVKKEWSEVFKNRFVFFTVAFLPLLFTVIPLFILYFSSDSGESTAISSADMPPQFAELCGGLTGGECMQYFIVSQFIMLFMLIPMIVPITFASYSIVGEKTTRTLEPLLATPITTIELLTGKALAAVIPGVGATWLSFGLFGIGASLMSINPLVLSKFVDPLWLTAIFVVGPLLAIAGVNIAMMISSRVSDPRVAEQISMVFVLPLIGLFVGQATGLIYLNEQLIIWMAIAMVVLDIALVAFAVQLFQRETILTRWK